MFRSLIFTSLLAVSLFTWGGCKSDSSHSQADYTTELQYAELLAIEEIEPGVSLCRIRDPWRTERVVMQYLLVPSTLTDWDDAKCKEATEPYGETIVLRTPLQHMALTASCHAWLLSQWDALDRVAVLCDTAYVMAPNVKQWMRSVRPDSTAVIYDGGSSAAPNKEVLLQAQCDALWISPFENAGVGNVSQLPIPIIYCADYMENSPLGRAEWMRFYGRLAGRSSQADSLFAQVAKRYEAAAHPDPNGPVLLAEIPYGSTWYVPGGRSTSAQLYADAGYRYLWADDTHAGSLSLSKEAVLSKGQTCDCWLVKYTAPEGDWSLQTLRQQEPLFSHIKAIDEGEVWGCNTAYSDFFDVTPFRPDSLLESLRAQDGHFYQRLK